MIKWRNLGLYDCTECGTFSEDIFELEVSTFDSVSSQRGFAKLCPECRKSMLTALVRITPATAQLKEPHGGRWFQIWKEDKENIIATMYKNLSADLEAGYSYSGKAIQSQLETIEEYKQDYTKNLDKFVYMSNEEVSRWCYYDLKKRGAIE